MRPSKVVKAVNWRHAIGELLLIVVGILIALAISDWNDRRTQRDMERALLSEVRSTLEADIATLETNLETFNGAAVQIAKLLGLLKNPLPYDPSMDQLFGAVYGARSTNLNTAAYEKLKSVGLQSVSNRKLRLGIGRVFDHFYERMEGEHEIDIRVNLDLLRPYYMKHFRDLKFWESATPLNYATIVSDDYFQNIVSYRLTVLSGNQLDSYALALDEMRKVLEMLNQELSN